MFLRFVYSGQLEAAGVPETTMSLETLSELLLLADRYELDSLKDVCETGLQSLMEKDSALTLFSIADHFNAAKLRVNMKSRVLFFL